MDLYELQSFIEQCMFLLNGRINTLLRCYKYEFSYIENASIPASENDGYIVFYMQKIYEDYYYMEPYIIKAHLLMICAHELSHIDQHIDYIKYNSDSDYRNWIERNNDMNAISWLMNNLDFLKYNLGDFDASTIIQFYTVLKDYPFKYIKMTKEQMISHITEKYLFKQNIIRFWEFSYVLLSIHICNESQSIYIKKGKDFINPNTLYPLLHELKLFNKVYIENRIPKGTNACIIEIDAYDEDKELKQILHKINSSLLLKINPV